MKSLVMRLRVVGWAIGISILLTAGTAVAGPTGVNLLANPGFETGDLTGWVSNGAGIRTSDPDPHSGAYYLIGGWNGSSSSTSQTIDLLAKGFTASELDSGALSVDFGGYQSGWHDQRDSGRISVVLENSASSALASQNLGWFYSNNTWTLKEGNISIVPGTRYVQFGFEGIRYDGGNCDAYLDDAFLKINGSAPVPLPTSLFLMGPGLAGLIAVRRRFRK